MIEKIQLIKFGPLSNIQWNSLGKINLIIGGNGSGKTFLLKAIYSSLRTIEEYKRGDDNRTAVEILADKLYWTFQVEKIGDLVSKGGNEVLSSILTVDGFDFTYAFGSDANKNIEALDNNVLPRNSNSIFLPAKEVLSLHKIILKSREQDKIFGFDDTYFDLAKALLLPSLKNMKEQEDLDEKIKEIQDLRKKSENKLLKFIDEVIDKRKNLNKIPINDLEELLPEIHSTLLDDNDKKNKIEYLNKINTPQLPEFTEARQKLEDILGGVIEYSEISGSWVFSKGEYKFPIGVTAEGIKKIAILDTLLGNRYLSSESVVLIDEPESALHPSAISQLLDIVALLAESGIQFFMASHSYFVVKKLYLIAQEKGWSIPVMACDDGKWIADDLKEGMPKNSILDESVRLYRQEMNLL